MLRPSVARTAVMGGALVVGLWLAGGSPVRGHDVAAQVTAPLLAPGASTLAPIVAPPPCSAGPASSLSPCAPGPATPPLAGGPADPAPVTLQGPAGETAILHQTTLANGDHCVTVVGQFSVAVTCTFAPAAAQTTP
jgi:hypothetical protein